MKEKDTYKISSQKAVIEEEYTGDLKRKADTHAERLRLVDKYADLEVPMYARTSISGGGYFPPRVTIDVKTHENFKEFRKTLKNFGTATIEKVIHMWGDRFDVTYKFSKDEEFFVTFATTEPEKFLDPDCRIETKYSESKYIICGVKNE